MASEESSNLLSKDKISLTKKEIMTKIEKDKNEIVCHLSSETGIGSILSNNERSLSGYIEIEDGEIEMARRSWKRGLAMAMISGVLCTASNFFIQYFNVDAIEMLLVRSGLQAIVLGAVVTTGRNCHISRNTELSVCSTRIWIGLQALLGSVFLLLNFSCLQYMPIGDALTLVFTEPLFTVILAFVFYRTKIGVTKGVFCICLVGGLLLSVQPPFLFSQDIISNNSKELSFKLSDNTINVLDNVFTNYRNDNTSELYTSRIMDDTEELALNHQLVLDYNEHESEQVHDKSPIEDFENDDKFGHDSTYYIGVALAVACAVCGALRNIVVSQKCIGISTTLLLSQCGLAGFFVSIIGCFIDDALGDGNGKGSRILFNMKELGIMDWTILFMISTVGILSYFALMEALLSISPTSVSVLRALEIVLAYICQILFIGVYPDVIGIGGSLLVMASVIGIAVEERSQIEA